MSRLVRNAMMGLFIVTLFGLGGCGGGGGGTPSDPAPTQKKLTVTTVQKGTAKDPLVVISTSTGDKISYFAPAIGANPTQAQLTTASGVSQTIYYAPDGTIDKVVNNINGSFLLFHPRSDGLGMEYLLYDATGTFLDGFALFQKNGVWNSAKILGLPAGVAGTDYGAAVYGPMTVVNSNLAAFLTAAVQQVAMNQTLFQMGLDIIIPSAYAFTNPETKNLIKGAALMAAAGLATYCAPPLAPVLYVAGTVKLLEGLSGQADRSVGVSGAVGDNLLTGQAVPLMNERSGFLEFGPNLYDRMSQGLVRVTDTVNNVVAFLNMEQRDISTLANPPQYLADTTPTPKSLPTSNDQSSMPIPTVPNYMNPIVDSVTPLTATLKQYTIFTVRGSNLKYGQLGFYLDNCYGISESEVSGSDTERMFSCIPQKPGDLKGTVTHYTYIFDTLKTFVVNVPDNSVLPAPTNFKVTKTGDMSWSMSWDAVAGATEYYVYQKLSSSPSVTPGRYNWNTMDYIDYIPQATAPSDTGTVDQAGTYYWVVVAASYDASNLDYVNLGKASTAASLTFAAAASTSTGQVSIWTNSSTTISSVSIDNSAVGSLTSYFATGAPTCGQSGTITKTLTVGSHTISASNSNSKWNPTNVTITAGNCTMFKLSGTSNAPPPTGEPLTPQTIIGNWSFNWDGTNATGLGTFQFISDGSFNNPYTATSRSTGATQSITETGTWTLAGTNMTLNYAAGNVYKGIASGNSTAFKMGSSITGGTLSFVKK